MVRLLRYQVPLIAVWAVTFDNCVPHGWDALSLDIRKQFSEHGQAHTCGTRVRLAPKLRRFTYHYRYLPNSNVQVGRVKNVVDKELLNAVQPLPKLQF